MTECLPNLPRFIIEREDGSWQGANHPDGPWRPIPAPQSGLPWPADGPAVPESREPASVTPEATGQPRQLSPAAQGIAQAFNDRYELCGPFDDNWQELCLAAALRAVADQVVPEGGVFLSTASAARTRRDVLAIAAELEGSNA